MATKIYTKTGDKGETSLIGGTKVPKSHIRIESYGNIDELNSFIGLLIDHLLLSPDQDADSAGFLRSVQDRLFTIGSSLACDPEKEPAMKIPDLKDADIVQLESEIDRMNLVLPPMRSFLLPGGHVIVSTAHICRCVCRRAERACVSLQEHQLFIDPLVIKYLNRLSDYLFVFGRYAGHRLGIAEIPWKPRL